MTRNVRVFFPLSRVTTMGLIALVLSCGGWPFNLAPHGRGQEEQERSVSFSAAVRIAKLLWDTNPASSATTLERILRTAVQRRQLAQAATDLSPLREQMELLVSTGGAADPRYRVAVAVLLTISETGNQCSTAGEAIERLVEQGHSVPDYLGQIWFIRCVDDALAMLDQWIGRQSTPEIADAVQAMLLAGIEQRPEQTTSWLKANWARLPAGTKTAVIEPMTSKRETMAGLLALLADHPADRDLVNPNQLRKWSAVEDAQMAAAIRGIWGVIRTQDDRSRRELVQQTLRRIASGATGSVTRGQAVYVRVCSQCHRLHGVGYEVGPPIDRNGRGSLEQLVSNILDPSLVIGEAFQARTVLTLDGEVVTGLLVEEDDDYVRLKVQGGKVIEFPRDEIEMMKLSTKSLMPEGVEQQMTEQEFLDLLAFLCLQQPPGSAENDLIPGTPDGFVTP
ncbi:MAG: hypothetical protein KatS3mg111_2469 [Pirellulaceae bacterium]|nr:MAG: hypothetical protein KatS3mg111_2469 [Pirellulaceae bacterium]